jgi:class 3 adenylate cyclase
LEKARTTPAKHIFLDVVGFTHNRSVEAQADIVGLLNKYISGCLEQNKVSQDKRILIPTGDGLCISLLNFEDPCDIHVRLALSILKVLYRHNADPDIDESRKFQVRVGLSANTDNLVTDINDKLNIAGAGINTAQRVMDKADGGQILVNQTVYEDLRLRESYMGSFRSYVTTDKHGDEVRVHQLLRKDASALNSEVPGAFAQTKVEEEPQVPQEPELTQHIAYYIAYAIKNYPALVPDKGFHAENVAITLLYFLANDSVDRANVTELEAFYPKTYQTESATFEEQYKYYSEIDENLVWYFARIVRWPPQDYLSRYNNCFAKDSFGMNLYRAVNDHGKRKLKAEWPQIWEELELHKYTNL